MANENNQTPISTTPKPGPKKLRAIHDRLIGILLTGATQKAAAAELGLDESNVSVICNTGVFKRAYRKRRAALIEDSDAILALIDRAATQCLIEALKFQKWQEVDDEGGGTVRVPPDMNIALQAAREVKRLNRERVNIDEIASRIDKLQERIKKNRKRAAG